MEYLTRFSMVLCYVFFLGSCSLIDSSEDPSWKQVPGIIEFYGDIAKVAISADTVQVDEPLEVTVTTFGGGCERIGGAKTDVSALIATIEPFDFTLKGDDIICTQELKLMSRTVTIHFRRAGIATLRIRGLKVNAGGRRMTILEGEVVVE